MSVIKFIINPNAEAEDLIFRVSEAESDPAVVYEETLTAPHSVQRTVIANGLDKVVHIVRLIGATSGFEHHKTNVEPSLEATVYDDIVFKIGDGGANTPAGGSDTYTNAELAGLDADDYKVFRNNYGYLIEGIHYSNNPGPGGFVLTAPDVFNDNPEGEEFRIQRKQQIVNSTVNDSVVGKLFKGFVDVSADTPWAADHLRKLIRFDGNVTYTFEAAAAVPFGYAHCFQNFGASEQTATVEFLNGPLKFGGSTVTSIELPAKTEACFTWDGTNWNVVYLIKSSEAAAPSSPQPGDLLGFGTINIGDVAAGDPAFTITHNLAIVGDYYVMLSIQSNDAATAYKNNKIGFIPWHWDASDKANKFVIMPQEISGEVQDISIWYEIKQA